MSSQKQNSKKNKAAPPDPSKMTKAQLLAHKKKEQQKKKKRRLYMFAGGGVFLALIIWMALQPYKGTTHFGLCRTFLELQVKFPQNIKMTSVDVFDQSLRMYYLYSDKAGGMRSEMMECEFRPYEQMNLHAVQRNRKPVDPEIVEKFNRTIPLIAHLPMDLVLPPGQSGDLMSLKID